MYLSSKYEDVYPLHSRIVAEKISHNAFTRHAILKKEEEFMRLFEFDFNFITPYDVYQSYFSIAEKKIKNIETQNFNKVKELSMLYIR